MLSPNGSAQGGSLSLHVPSELVAAIADAVADELERRGALSPKGDSPYLTVEEAAEYLRCSPQAIYDRVHQGVLRPRRDGRRLLFRRDRLDDYLEEAA